MEEERRQLHKAVEKEHNFIVAEKARLKIEKRLGPSNLTQYPRDNLKSSLKISPSNIHDVSKIAKIRATPRKVVKFVFAANSLKIV